MSSPAPVMRAGPRPRILCVDDEPRILESLRDTLRRNFDVRTATSGPEGLVALRETTEEWAVIISDMRMPLMTGSVFLREARRLAPDATRILLTGYADLDAAVAAINDGQLFRFLTKPCPSDELLEACHAALEQYRLRTAERVLLEQTLRGSVKALTDTLALASPAAFGRGARVRKHVVGMVRALGAQEDWQIEVSAALVHLGAVTLPPETAEKLYAGELLTAGEQEMVSRVPGQTRRILENIPRLEGVREILECYPRPVGRSAGAPVLPLGARILRIALDFDLLDAQGADRSIALAAMRGRAGVYDPEVLDVFERVIGSDSSRYTVCEISVGRLQPGMMLAADVRSETGSLLIARGNTATEQLITRLMNLRSGSIHEPLMIIDETPSVAAATPAKFASGKPVAA
ncbi:MAG: HD domain-containing phosphohydrolase [Solirubrobacteraceae bacterium]